MSFRSNVIKNQYVAIISCFLIFVISFAFAMQKIKTADIYYNQIPSNLIKSDLDLLEEYLDFTYAGQFILRSEYETLKKDISLYKSVLKNPISRVNFLGELNLMLDTLNDGHLYAIYNNYQKPLYEKKIAIENRTKPSFEFKNIKNQKILTLKINSFVTYDDSEFDKIFDVLKENLSTIDILIFDLTENVGGSMAVPMKMASIIWEEIFRNRYLLQYFPTPYTKEYVFNNDYTAKILKEYDKNKGYLATSFFNATNLKKFSDNKANNKVIEVLNTYYDYTKPLKKIPFENIKKIFALTDTECASACEKLIEALELHPKFIHVGQQTAGYTQFTNIGYLLLPNSQLLVSIPIRAIEYYDHRKVEKVGYKPKVEFKGDSHLLNHLYEYIESEFK
jgi:hypothetical protein